jgi:hypothetical protein
MNATTQSAYLAQIVDTMARFSAWLYDILIGFVRSLTNGQRALLIAEIGFASVGAYSSYLYYAPTRGLLFGTVAAVSIVLLYIGGAGAAVKYPWQQYLAWGLVLIGTLSEIFFGVMIGLREVLPGLFNPAQALPSGREWAVLGAPAILEGALPSLCALLISVLLQSMVTNHMKELADEKVHQREAAMPFECPFCPDREKTEAALYGHFGRCTGANGSTLTTDEKKAILRKAVDAGRARKASL